LSAAVLPERLEPPLRVLIEIVDNHAFFSTPLVKMRAHVSARRNLRCRSRGIAVLNAALYASGILARGSAEYPRYVYQEASDGSQ
jgi:hypothetical protein